MESRSLALPPATPALGSCYIVPAAGATAWGHPAGTLLHWQGAGWLARTPRDGQIVMITDESAMLVHGGNWQAQWPVTGLRVAGRTVLAASPGAVALPSGGSVVDSQARATLAVLVAALQQQGIVN